MCLASICTADKWQGHSGLACTFGRGSSEDARAASWGSWECLRSLRQRGWGGSQRLVALTVTSSTPTRLQILNLTFLTTLQVSEYVRISTNSHDALVTRGGCWWIDERMGAGDVGEDKPRKTGFT